MISELIIVILIFFVSGEKEGYFFPFLSAVFPIKEKTLPDKEYIYAMPSFWYFCKIESYFFPFLLFITSIAFSFSFSNAWKIFSSILSPSFPAGIVTVFIIFITFRVSGSRLQITETSTNSDCSNWVSILFKASCART